MEYTLTVPTRYSGGRYTVSYPRHNGVGNLAVPILHIHPGGTFRGGKYRARITVNGRRVARAQYIALRQNVVKPLPGTMERKRGVSYAVSTQHVRRRGLVESVKVRVDIRHTLP